MNFLNGQCFIEVKDKRYRTHPNEKIIPRERDPLKPLRTQYQVQNENQLPKNQKNVEINGKLEVKNYPRNKTQPVFQHHQLNFEPNTSPSCRQNNWLEFEKGYFCQKYE